MTQAPLLSEQHDLLVKLSEAHDIRKRREADSGAEKEKDMFLAKELLEKEMASAESILELKVILSDLLAKLETSHIAKMAVFAPKQSKRLVYELKDIRDRIVESRTLDPSHVSVLKVRMAEASTLFDDSYLAAKNEIIRHQNKIDALNEAVSELEAKAKSCRLFLNSLPLIVICSCLTIICFSEVAIHRLQMFDDFRFPGWLDTIYYTDSGFFIVYLVGCVAAFVLAIYKLIKRKH